MLKKVRKTQKITLVVLVSALILSGCAANKKQALKTTAETAPPVVEPMTENAPDLEASTSSDSEQAHPVQAEDQYKLALELLKSNENSTVAVKWLERAALQGHGDAAYRLGFLQNQPKSKVDWYSMAASVGQIDAQFALGKAYLNGHGTAKEPAWGLLWIERAARAGHAQAQFSMGVAMATGLTGKPLRDEGLVWLLIAQKNGYAHADSMISILQARLSSTVVEQVVLRAKSWTNEPSGDAQNRANVRFAQYALGRMGFDAGLVDGILGDRTVKAVQAFRKDRHMDDGPIDANLLYVLRERLSILIRS